MQALGRSARGACVSMSLAESGQRNAALAAAAAHLRERSSEIIAANALDLKDAEARGLSGAMLDRLMLDEARPP